MSKYRILVHVILPLMLVAGLMLLAGCGCQVETGDLVSYDGRVGQVRAIKSWASGTENCIAGVAWNDGTTDYIDAWRLDP